MTLEVNVDKGNAVIALHPANIEKKFFTLAVFQLLPIVREVRTLHPANIDAIDSTLVVSKEDKSSVESALLPPNI